MILLSSGRDREGPHSTWKWRETKWKGQIMLKNIILTVVSQHHEHIYSFKPALFPPLGWSCTEPLARKSCRKYNTTDKILFELILIHVILCLSIQHWLLSFNQHGFTVVVNQDSISSWMCPDVSYYGSCGVQMLLLEGLQCVAFWWKSWRLLCVNSHPSMLILGLCFH